MSISGAASGLFSNWSARADLEDARNVAIDQATIAVLQLHAPEIAARYLDDDLPDPFERLLDRATAAAGSRDGAAFIDRYRIALVAMLAETSAGGIASAYTYQVSSISQSSPNTQRSADTLPFIMPQSNFE